LGRVAAVSFLLLLGLAGCSTARESEPARTATEELLISTAVDRALDGLQLKIPEGTQNGAQFKLRNKGVPILNTNGRGDMYVHVSVKMPTRLTRDQRKLMEQLRDSLPVDNRPAEKGLFEKVKDYFM